MKSRCYPAAVPQQRRPSLTSAAFTLSTQHVADLPHYFTRLEELVLGGSFRVRDATVADAVKQLPHLKKFHYHHSLAVGKDLLAALGHSKGEWFR